MNILITGASGFIGRALCTELATEHRIFGYFRRKPTQSCDQHRLVVQHIRDVDAPLDAVVNLAGENIGGKRWSEPRKRALRDSRIGFTQLLLEELAANDQHPHTWVNASAVGIYGSRPGQQLTENSPAGNDFAAKLCYDWEQVVNDAPLLSNSRKVILRLGVVIGPGGVIEQMRIPFALGLGTALGPGLQHMPWISLADVTRIIRFALVDPAYSGPINAVSEHPQTQTQFSDALAKALNRPRFLRLPTPFLKLLFGEMSSILLADQLVTPQALQDIGFRFSHPQINQALDYALARQTSHLHV